MFDPVGVRRCRWLIVPESCPVKTDFQPTTEQLHHHQLGTTPNRHHRCDRIIPAKRFFSRRSRRMRDHPQRSFMANLLPSDTRRARMPPSTSLTLRRHPSHACSHHPTRPSLCDWTRLRPDDDRKHTPLCGPRDAARCRRDAAITHATDLRAGLPRNEARVLPPPMDAHHPARRRRTHRALLDRPAAKVPGRLTEFGK